MVEVLPIAATAVDWPLYLKTARQVLARSVTQELDNRRIVVGNLGTFIATLAELVKQGANPQDALMHAGHLLEHAHCAFMVMATMPVTFELMQQSRLSFTSVESIQSDFQLSIVSGTITKWRTAIIDCSTDQVSTNVRLFANKTLAHLTKMGFGDVFNECVRSMMFDETFKLTRRDV